MADIATVFGWSPRDMDPMDPWELAAWWERARERAQGEDED